MLIVLGNKNVLLSSLLFLSIMFVIVMFYVNPSIDGVDGSGVLELQLSLHKNDGIEIIDRWGESGIENFKFWIFTDYIYAFAYSLFLASLVSFIVIKKGKEQYPIHKWIVYLAFYAGLLDCIENTMELFFINDPYNFSSLLFFLHSIFAIVKWLAITVVVAHIVILLFVNKEPSVQNR